MDELDTKGFTKAQLEMAIKHSRNYSDVFYLLNMKPHSNRYAWLKSVIKNFEISITHFWPYDKENFSKICAESSSIAQVLEKLELTKFSGNYATIRAKVMEYGIDIGHWNGQNKVRRGVTNDYSDLASALTENSSYSRYRLKKRLLEQGLLKNECAFNDCPTRGMKNWRGQEIPYEIDHINGISNDNRLENLRMLCTICHKQTPTFGSKNMSITPKRPEPICLDCGERVSQGYTACLSCSHNGKEKIVWPTNEDLLHLVRTTNLTQTARVLSKAGITITANSIKKRLKVRGLWNPE